MFRNLVWVIPLETAENNILKKDPKHKNIKTPPFKTLSIKILTIYIKNVTFHFETFINLENSVLAEYHNTKAVHSAAELKLLKSRFENAIQLWVAKYNNEIIAGTLLFVYDNVVHTQYMAADDTARKIGGLDLLIKTVMDNFADSKTYFDFGISSENNGKYLNTGLISQKEGFGGRTAIYQTWEISV